MGMKNIDELNEMLNNVFETKRMYERAVLERLQATKPMPVVSDVDDDTIDDPLTLMVDNASEVDTYEIDTVKAEDGMILCHVRSIDGVEMDEWYPHYFFGSDDIYILASIRWD